MAERPILFSAPMVRAILEGRKTQTRRVVKLPRGIVSIYRPFERDPRNIQGVDKDGLIGWYVTDASCPYGRPGDRLWVRETWQYADWTEDGYPFIGYRANGARVCFDKHPEEWGERLSDIWAELSKAENYSIDNRAADRRWRPAIHMPRWACRIELEVTGVRVERLCEISEQDAIAEGIPAFMETPSNIPRLHYSQLWEKINGPGSWNANPWVWVVEFKPLELSRSATQETPASESGPDEQSQSAAALSAAVNIAVGAQGA